jgi:hypothetical protein
LNGTVNGFNQVQVEGQGTGCYELGDDSSKFDHVFRAVTYASCGDEGVAVKGTGNRQYAVFYVLEGGAISCNDNH